MSKTSDKVVSLKNVSFRYGRGPLVLERVSLDIEDREFLGVVGPNAGGKSTLLKLVLGLIRGHEGEISVLGASPKLARRHVGYVPQYPTFPRDFPADVLHTVLMGRLGVTGGIGGYKEADRQRALEALQELEIESLSRRRLNTLSGGQLQRVLVARALICDPQLLLLDEPTSNIDQRMESDIFDYLKTLNRKMAIVLVSHDIGFISGYVHRVACLNRSLICHATEEIDGRVIQDLYGSDVHMVAHHH